MEKYEQNDALRILYPKMGELWTFWVAAKCIIGSCSMHVTSFFIAPCIVNNMYSNLCMMVNKRGNAARVFCLHLLSYPRSLMTFHLKRMHVWQFIVASNLCLHVKCPTSLPSFNKMWCFPKMFMRILSIKFQGIRRVGVALIHAEGDMDL